MSEPYDAQATLFDFTPLTEVAPIEPYLRQMFGHNPEDHGLVELILVRIEAARKHEQNDWSVTFLTPTPRGGQLVIGQTSYPATLTRQEVLPACHQQIQDEGIYEANRVLELPYYPDDPKIGEDPRWIVGYTIIRKKLGKDLS